MKKLPLTFVLLVSFCSMNAQNDGYGRPVKGAFWNQGIDGIISKYVHNKIHTTGDYDIHLKGITYQISVEVLTDKKLVLFAKDNYANRNRNYIKVPNGKLWNHIHSPNKKRLAECGNLVTDVFEVETKYLPGKTIIKKVYVDRPIGPTDPETTCDVNAGQLEAFKVLYKYETTGVLKFYELKDAQRDMDAVTARYPCLGQITVQRAHKGKQIIVPIVVAGAAFTAAYLIYKKQRNGSSGNSGEVWKGNPTNHGRENFNANTTNNRNSNTSRSTQMVYQRGQRSNVNMRTNNISLLNGRKY